MLCADALISQTLCPALSADPVGAQTWQDLSPAACTTITAQCSFSWLCTVAHALSLVTQFSAGNSMCGQRHDCMTPISCSSQHVRMFRGTGSTSKCHQTGYATQHSATLTCLQGMFTASPWCCWHAVSRELHARHS